MLPKGRVQKKKLGIFPGGGGGLLIWTPFPNFFNLFLNMVWIIQKCKEILLTPWGVSTGILRLHVAMHHVSRAWKHVSKFLNFDMK